MHYTDRFKRNAGICGGQTVIRGTRVTVRTLLAALADGTKPEDILEELPSLSEDDIRAVIAFAAASAEEDMPVLGTPLLR